MRLIAILCLALAACHGAPAAAPPPCQKRVDCGADQTCRAGACVPLCASDAACSGGLACVAGYCVASVCGDDVDCGPELVCRAGGCTEPGGAVASCTLVPALTVLRDGVAGEAVTVLARDDKGAVLPGQLAIFTGSGAVSIDNSGVPTGAGAGPGTLTAQLGAVSCSAQTTSHGAPPAGATRAVVIDRATGRPLAGAVVALDDARVTAVTDHEGVALFAQATPGPHDVHVFLDGFSFASFLGTGATDLLIPLKAEAWPRTPSYVTGQLGLQDFAKLDNPALPIHGALFGVSQPGSALDFSLDAFNGELNLANVEIGPLSTRLSFGTSIVLGTANGFASEGRYRLIAEPGQRVVWGFGGNLDAAALANGIDPVNHIDPGSNDPSLSMARLAPLLDSFQAGVVAGVGVPDRAAGGAPPNPDLPIPVPLGLSRKLRVLAEVPDLPSDANGVLQLGLVVAGVRMGALGTVPLGFTAGAAAVVQGVRTGKVLDPHCDPLRPGPGCIGNQLPLQLAPESGGLEGNPITLAVAATSSSGSSSYLGPGTNSGSNTSASVLLATLPAVHAGQVLHVAGPFLPLPDVANGVQFALASRTLAVRPDLRLPAQALRFDLESRWGHTWRVWLAPGSRTATLPLPPAKDGLGFSLLDPLLPLRDRYVRELPPTSRVFAVQFEDPSIAVPDLASFGARSAARAKVHAFSVAPVPLRQ